MLVSTHNLGSVPEFCDRTILLEKYGARLRSDGKPPSPAKTWSSPSAGVLRHFVLGGENLHDDADPRQLSVISDDERPLVMYGARDRMVAQPAKPESDSERTPNDRHAHRALRL